METMDEILARVDAARDWPLGEVKERLALDVAGLEMPLDPDEAERLRLTADAGIGEESAVDSMDAEAMWTEWEEENG